MQELKRSIHDEMARRPPTFSVELRIELKSPNTIHGVLRLFNRVLEDSKILHRWHLSDSRFLPYTKERNMSLLLLKLMQCKEITWGSTSSTCIFHLSVAQPIIIRCLWPTSALPIQSHLHGRLLLIKRVFVSSTLVSTNPHKSAFSCLIRA